MLGYAVEMSIANLFKTPYPLSSRVLNRFQPAHISSITKTLSPLFKHPILQQPFSYIGNNKGPIDFISSDSTHQLSVKSNYKTSLICPQTIGQTTTCRFNHFLGLNPDSEPDEIKYHIEININELLTYYEDHTFGNSKKQTMIYYNDYSKTAMLIQRIQPIDWFLYPIMFSHQIYNHPWGSSSTIYTNAISIGQFQFHSNRNVVKFRFCLKNLLKTFPESFLILSS